MRNTSIPIPHDAAAFQPHLLIDSAGRVFLSNGGVSIAFLYSFNPDLSLRWQEAIAVVSAPALGSNGTLVVCGSGTDVRAYRTVSPWSFYTVTPCRIADTRGAASPLGGPPLAAGTERSFLVAGACSIPGSARAASVNVTVTGPTAQGHLTLFPGGSPVPPTSTINYRTGQTRANNAVANLGPDGSLSVRSAQPHGSVYVVIDVNGYFQ